jgi:hypothetical protein
MNLRATVVRADTLQGVQGDSLPPSLGTYAQ